MAKNKIVLAYSGGLDTSIAIKWLQEKYDFDVIAVAIDVGEGKDLDFIKNKALKIGAIQCHLIDAKETFAYQHVLPALKANALYENIYPLISALSRPLIAKMITEIANTEGAIAVAHGCTGKGNDQVRFDVSFNILAPELNIIAPVRESPMGREEAIKYAQLHGIPLPIDLDNPFSIDQNLWGRSCECGILEDPWQEPPEAAYEWTASLAATPDEATEIEIEFLKGEPIAINQQKMQLPEMISHLNEIAGQHGVGRIDHIENRLIGIKSREVYEAPAAITLIKAHRALETLTLPKEVFHFKPMLEQKIANLIYEGLWYSPLRKAIMAFIEETQQSVSGTVRIKLHKGHAVVVGRKSTQSLYKLELATYKSQDQFDHVAANGFIKLWGLPSKIYALMNNTVNE
jgi:argininosuccinate synthase